jgi:hypothetical protein
MTLTLMHCDQLSWEKFIVDDTSHSVAESKEHNPTVEANSHSASPPLDLSWPRWIQFTFS